MNLYHYLHLQEEFFISIIYFLFFQTSYNSKKDSFSTLLIESDNQQRLGVDHRLCR